MPWGKIVIFAGGFVVSFVVSLLVTAFVVSRLPADYFVRPRRSRPESRHPAVHGLLVAGKNLLGIALVVLGLLLSLPGIPGQGLLTVLLGVMLVDFPGKHRFERWMVRKPRIERALNWIRRKFRRPPFARPHDPSTQPPASR